MTWLQLDVRHRPRKGPTLGEQLETGLAASFLAVCLIVTVFAVLAGMDLI